MPVVSTHCLANHRGGVGKTTLTFQLSSAYALAHPDLNVLVIDASDVGDLSEMLMGGLYEKRGRETLHHLVPLANTTRLFLQALAAYSTTHLKESIQDDDVSAVVSRVLKDMPKAVRESNELVGEHRLEQSALVNIREYAIPLKHVNPRLPNNMYICPSGLDIEQNIVFSDSQWHNIISVLRESFKAQGGQWKIFIDTDAGFENDVYCNISVGISDFCLLPLHADMTDWYRVCPLLQEIRALHDAGISDAKVQMILWNGLTVKFNARCNQPMGPKGSVATCTFTPTKAEQDIISSLNDLVFKEAEKYPALFHHYNGDETDAEEFSAKSSMCVRNFSVVGVASKDAGIPICCIAPGTFHGAHMTYLLNEATIERCRENLNELVKAVDEATNFLEQKRSRSSPLIEKSPTAGRRKRRGRSSGATPSVDEATGSLEQKRTRSSTRKRKEQSPGATPTSVDEATTSLEEKRARFSPRIAAKLPDAGWQRHGGESLGAAALGGEQSPHATPSHRGRSSGATSRKKKAKDTTTNTGDGVIIPVKIHNTRNKYPLRDRARKLHIPLGLIEFEYSSTSTIQTAAA